MKSPTASARLIYPPYDISRISQRNASQSALDTAHRASTRTVTSPFSPRPQGANGPAWSSQHAAFRTNLAESAHQQPGNIGLSVSDLGHTRQQAPIAGVAYMSYLSYKGALRALYSPVRRNPCLCWSKIVVDPVCFRHIIYATGVSVKGAAPQYDAIAFRY